MTSLRKRILFAISMVVIPIVLFLLLLEGILRLSGFGFATTPLIKVDTEGESYWVGNPDFTRLYFPSTLKRLPTANRIPVDKSPQTRRYMVVGGSAAAGDPDTDFSIARNLEWLLSNAQPETRWEVLNLAYTACNSHVAAEVVRQSGQYDLDGIIVLVGNNEVIGPYGPGTTLTDTLPSGMRRQLETTLRKTKTGQLGQVLREGLASDSGESESWRGMGHFLEHRIAADDPRLEQVYENFGTNLDSMEAVARKQGIPILLATVPVNLLDHPPFQSDDTSLPEALANGVETFLSTGQSPLGVQEVVSARKDHPQSANLAYMAGRMFHETGQPDEANKQLAEARDLDLLRFRADARINELITQRWTREETNWIPIDAESPIIADNPNSMLGFPHFYEHVHFSLRANFLIAREMATAILEHEKLDTTAPGRVTWGEAAAGLAYTPYEAWVILEEIERRFGHPPFTEITGYDRLTKWMDDLREALHIRISTAEEKERMTQAYLSAIQNRLWDDRILLNFANFLLSFGRRETAFDILEEIQPRHPTESEITITWLNLCLEFGRTDEARQALARLESIFPEHPNMESFRERLEAM